MTKNYTPQIDKETLLQKVEQLEERLHFFENRMLNKAEVAKIYGMTVSWLDNSQSEKAKALRTIAVRYGRSPSSPVRFPLKEVIFLSCQSER